MASDWDEGSLTWPDVPNLKPLVGDDAINATRHNFIRQAHHNGFAAHGSPLSHLIRQLHK